MTMKKVSLLFLLGALMFAFAACEKEGPAGPQGAQGTQGPAGVPGPTGNANVIQFSLPGVTLSDGAPDIWQNIPLTHDLCNSSIIVGYLGYMESTLLWYPMPGLSYGGTFDYRAYYFGQIGNTDSTTYVVRRLTGTGDDIVDSIRIVVIPASVFYAAEPAERPDLKNYEAVRSFYDIH